MLIPKAYRRRKAVQTLAIVVCIAANPSLSSAQDLPKSKAGLPMPFLASFVVGVDGSAFALDKIGSGELDATVSQPLNLYAGLSAHDLQRAVGDEVFKDGAAEHGSTTIRNAAGNLEDLLPSPLVTRGIVDEPALWGNQANPK